jgi:hypothetical protein
MDKLDQFTEIIAAYGRHGWQVRRALMTAETLSETSAARRSLFENLPVDETLIDIFGSHVPHK